VLRAGNGEEDLRRQHVEVAGEHDRVAEVGEALDEAQQERVGERGRRSGHVTVRKTRALDARSVCAASSSDGLTAAMRRAGS
jgi:hypothetical protein